MRVAIHQPHYLPWLRYFHKIARCDCFIVLDTIQYEKNGWQNRNRIKGPQGPILLTVPVHAPLGTTINAVTIDNTQPWRRIHPRAITQSYARSPHYPSLAPLLNTIYDRSWDRLADLNLHMLRAFLDLLGIQTRIVLASDLNVLGAASERLAALIHAVGGDTYLSGAYAADAYLDPEVFSRSGIRLEFQSWTPPQYPQLHGPFIPELSIIDLLAQCGPDSLRILLEASP